MTNQEEAKLLAAHAVGMAMLDPDGLIGRDIFAVVHVQHTTPDGWEGSVGLPTFMLPHFLGLTTWSAAARTALEIACPLGPVGGVTRVTFALSAQVSHGPEHAVRSVDVVDGKWVWWDPCPLCGENRSHPTQHGRHACNRRGESTPPLPTV